MHKTAKKESLATVLCMDTPKESLVEPIRLAERVKTPEWIIKRYPNAPKTLSRRVVDDFNAQLERARNLVEQYEKEQKDNDLVAYYKEKAREEKRDLLEIIEEVTIFTYYMNNFSYYIFHQLKHFYSDEELRQKIGNARNGGGNEASGLIKNQTRKEFLDTVRAVIAKCGLSYEKAEEMFKNKASPNRYLFPAFLRLLDMGYKSYPDLSA